MLSQVEHEKVYNLEVRFCDAALCIIFSLAIVSLRRDRRLHVILCSLFYVFVCRLSSVSFLVVT